MSFGFSVSDSILLIDAARTQYNNCVAAGAEYHDLARDVKTLHSVLELLHDESLKASNKPVNPTRKLWDKIRFGSKIQELGEEALKAKSASPCQSTVSLLSMSTYNEDDKEVWLEFRRQLISKGFKSNQLDKHSDMLQAYLLKLVQ
ncbi:hypothetical protein BGZ57DRAFT_734160, partial [Hyaloscypha finlandica]